MRLYIANIILYDCAQLRPKKISGVAYEAFYFSKWFQVIGRYLGKPNFRRFQATKVTKNKCLWVIIKVWYQIVSWYSDSVKYRIVDLWFNEKTKHVIEFVITFGVGHLVHLVFTCRSGICTNRDRENGISYSL